jgi:hypothetical protein
MHRYGITIVKDKQNAPQGALDLMQPYRDLDEQAGPPDEQGLSGSRPRQTRFNWMVIGGRWNGALRPEPAEAVQAARGGRNLPAPRIANLEVHVGRVADIVDGALVPDFVVTPDGAWHDFPHGEGWLDFQDVKQAHDGLDAPSAPEPRAWLRGLLAPYPDHFAVVVDAHG